MKSDVFGTEKVLKKTKPGPRMQTCFKVCFDTLRHLMVKRHVLAGVGGLDIIMFTSLKHGPRVLFACSVSPATWKREGSRSSPRTKHQTKKQQRCSLVFKRCPRFVCRLAHHVRTPNFRATRHRWHSSPTSPSAVS